jgi:hypothetical protein
MVPLVRDGVEFIDLDIERRAESTGERRLPASWAARDVDASRCCGDG